MAALVESTLEACSLLNLENIPKEWTDQVWNDDFCEDHGLPEVLEENASEKLFYKGELENLLSSCRRWAKSTQDSSSEGFWKVLSDNDISLRSLIAVLYTMIESCKRQSHPGPKLESAVLCASIYVVLLQIPGSGAYNVYHHLLLQKSVDVFKHWPQKENSKRKRNQGSQDNNKKSVAGRRAKTRRTAKDIDEEDGDNESDDDEDDDSDADDGYDTGVSLEALVTRAKTRMVGLLQDLVLFLSTFSLKGSEQTCVQIVQRLANMVKLDTSTAMPTSFDLPERSLLLKTKSVVQLGYTGLGLLCTSLHGNVGSNTRNIFKSLIPLFLMADAGSTLLKEVQLIKDFAVEFACYIASKNCSESQNAVRVLIQHLCTKCPDKADYRVAVAKAAGDILKCLPDSCYSSLMEWLLKYSKNAKTGYRIFALDLVSELLTHLVRQVTGEENAQEGQQAVMSKKYLLEIIVGRSSDRAPTVRAKALQYLSQCATSSNPDLVNLVKQTLKEPVEKSVNSGESYNVGSMIRKRTCDEKVGVRKAALQVLESVIHLDLNSLHKPDLVVLHDRCMDRALSVRRQAMVSLTALLQEKPTNTDLQSLWLDGILPLVLDRETTAQDKCYSTLEDIILNKIVPLHRSIAEPHILAWDLLQIVASPSGQEVRRYLQNACQYWSKQGKINNTLIKSLTSHINSDHNKSVWLLLSQMASASVKVDHIVVIQAWKNYSTKQDCDDETLCWVLSVIGSVSDKLPEDVVTSLTEDLQRKLSGFCNTPEVIAAIIGTLCKLCRSQPQAKAMIESWCADLLKACEQTLSSVVLDADQETKVRDETIVKNLFTVGEVAQLAPGKTTERLFMLVESMLITEPNPNTPGTPPLQKYQLSSMVKAHAFVTLGKLCLQNENLAKKCTAALARELEVSDNAAIRNNVIVIMCDLCVRYTSLVDRYIPNIATCLRDSAPLVRRQTLTLLTHLLQEDYVKWKGSLFYHFITALVDEDKDIRKFADFCLVRLLLARHPGMFYQHFIECIFHFNSYDKHKVFNKFSQTEREKRVFSLKGDANASKRSIIYQFLLSHMSDEDRFNLTGKLCQEVLGGIADGVIPLDSESGVLLKDTLSVLCSKGIKLSSMRTKAADDMVDEGDIAGAAMVQAKTKFLTQVVKKNMIENIIPIIIELKHLFEKERSPLLKDLLSYLKDVMKDYRNEVKEVLSVDKQLANEIEFDLRKFEEEEKELQEQKKRKQQETIVTPGTTPGYQSPRRNQTSNFITPLSSGISSTTSTNKTPLPPSSCPRTNRSAELPKTPIHTRRHTLATACLINSARKAMSQASKVAEEKRRRSSTKEAAPDAAVKPAGDTPKTPANNKPLTPLIENNQEIIEDEVFDSADQKPSQTPVRKPQATRAASTPEGNVSRMSKISFCMNVSAIPPSPIPTSLPIRIYPKDKDAQPGWISKKGVDEDGQENLQEVICLPSPEQNLPKPRRWNVQSPDKNQSNRTRTKATSQNISVANRTRSKRSTSRK